MYAIKSYIYSYPKWFRIVNLTISPILCFAMLLGGAMSHDIEILPAYYAYWSAMYAGVAIYCEFYAMCGLYKKAEPFGSMLLSSPNARRFMRGYVIMDCLRNLIFTICVIVLPVLFTGYGIAKIIECLSLALITDTVISVTVCINRHADNNLVLIISSMFAIMITAFLSVYTDILLNEMPPLLILLFISALICGMAALFCVRFGIKRLERSFYDDRD